MSSKLSKPDAGPGHRREGTTRRHGMPPTMQVFLLVLPFTLTTGLAVSRVQGFTWHGIIDLWGIAVAALVLSRALGLRLRIRGLVDNSSVLVTAGKKKLFTLVQTFCVLELGVILAVLVLYPLNGSLMPHILIWIAVLQASIFLNFSPLRSSVQYWLRTCVVLGSKVIAYEQIESVIQIPWQGFDVRLKGRTEAVEIRMKNDAASPLLDTLKPVLSPYGIKLQTRSGEKSV